MPFKAGYGTNILPKQGAKIFEGTEKIKVS